ncbi:MAG: Calx-beta domain-containing protein [Reyranellaceae bacterium]
MANVSYTIGDNWGSGFIGNVAVSAGSQALSGWTLEFDAAFTITNIWGAEIVSHVGNHYVLRNASWTGSVAAGAQASFGFQATTTPATGTAASGFALNGADLPSSPPTLSIADVSIGEGNGGSKQMTFTVTLSQASSTPVSVAFATADGTAKAGTDYTARSGTLTFAAGETSKTISVAILGDTVVEADEAFTLALSTPSGATLARGTATGTIVNDDTAPVPTLSIADTSLAEGNSGSKLMTFTVTLSQAAASSVSVAYATADGTAKAGSDFTAASGTLTFAAGETSKTISVAILGDTAVEADEAFSLVLSTPSGATLARGTATGTILNDDTAPAPTLTIADASVTEGNSGSKLMTFTVTLSQAASAAVSVAYATADGTAKAGSDYTAASGTLTFAAGETSKTVSVAILGDTAVESDEAFSLVLSAPSGATLARGTATGTIANDDTAGPAGGATLGYSVASNWGSGFTGAMTLTAGTTAINGWTVEFNSTANITSIWNAVVVSHVGDHYVVRNASYNAQVASGAAVSFGFNATPGSGGTAASSFTINGVPAGDTPPPLPTLAVADVSVTEGNSGTQTLTFAVKLSAAASGPVTVRYATADGTATAGSDYTAAAGTLTFAAGETSKVVQVQVAGDTLVEGDETLTLALSGATGATLSRGTATGTILNDDTGPVPGLSIGNASFAEGSAAAPGSGVFTVTLSAAATTPVSVRWATADGTATAGSDYVAQSGTLTFAVGETSKTISVAAIGDSVVEANETFKVVLSGANGATISTATGTGTIRNDDTATLKIGNVSVAEGSPGAVAPGWFSTSGNQIVDSAGHSVEIAGVNWFGFESSNLAPHGLWARGYKEMMDQMVQLGFNTIRLPFSSELLHTTAAPNGIDFSKNADLQGLSGLQVMDKIVDYAGKIGLRIILDHHRSEAGAGTSGNGLWYNSQYTQAQWVADWQMLASRYGSNPTVIGADLHNEPYNGTWGGGGANDWAAAAEQAGNAIGSVNPNWLVFVEGIGTYKGQSYWWGGNLMGVKDRPIQLALGNKLVYSAHDYPNSVYPQSWFSDPSFPANLPAKFDQMWGYIYRQNIAPVWIGEFGTKLVDPKDAPWLKAITSYLGGDFNGDGTSDIAAGQKGISWTYWSWNPNSGDTGGIVGDDWKTVNQAKLAYLTPIESPFGSTASNVASFVVTLSQAAATTVTVDYHTVAGDATSADFTPVSGTLTFAPGETTKTIAVPITPDSIAEGNEQFTVVLTNAAGATIATATGTATILDDDSTAGAAALAAKSFSPYIDMAMPVDADLTAISKASGIRDFTLAFVLSSNKGIGWQGTGGIADDGLANGSTILAQVQAIQAAGGNITISFGGAAGQEAALTAPNATALQAEYQSVIDRYHVTSIDFDIEGAATANTASLALRDQAIVGLQAANPGLRVSFTLPVLPTGLDANGLGVLQAAKRDGVHVDLVNLMAMDYGSAVDNGGQMGLDAINAVIATEKQLDALGLDAKIGVTPMIGVNDVASETFTLADAQALVDFAASDPRVTQISMWSVARDNGNSAGAHFASPDSSGIAQGNFAFSAIFNQVDRGA